MSAQGLAPDAETRFQSYLDQIGGLLRDKRQRASFAMYAAGLLGDGDRKSMEPMAARLCGDPDNAGATHQKFMHFIGTTAWHDKSIRERAAHYAVDEMQRHQSITTWIIDDTGFLKQGFVACLRRSRHGGVARSLEGRRQCVAKTEDGPEAINALSYAFWRHEHVIPPPLGCMTLFRHQLSIFTLSSAGLLVKLEQANGDLP